MSDIDTDELIESMTTAQALYQCGTNPATCQRCTCRMVANDIYDLHVRPILAARDAALDEVQRLTDLADTLGDECGAFVDQADDARRERDEARAALCGVRSLCAQFDPASGASRARAFVSDLRVVAARPVNPETDDGR